VQTVFLSKKRPKKRFILRGPRSTFTEINKKNCFMSRTKNRVKSASCPNCHKAFADEQYNFCPHCGQENHTHKLPVKHFAMELLESFTHFDTKVIATFKDLIFTPGLVIQKFNDNKRARYVPPIRIYAFTSFAFFLVLSFSTNNKVEKTSEELKEQIREQRNTSGSYTQINLFNKTRLDSTTIPELIAHPSLTNELIDSTLRSKKIETDWFNTRILHTILKVRKGELSIVDLYHKFVKYASYTVFALMPIFALLMMLFYRKRNYFYSEFLVFSIYFHTFLFSVFGVLVIFFRFFNIDFNIITAFLLLGMVVYLGLSLKRVFADSTPKTILKTVLLSATYSFLLFVTIMFLTIGSMI
jgi:Protein of unknown function (DUF3667)